MFVTRSLNASVAPASAAAPVLLTSNADGVAGNGASYVVAIRGNLAYISSNASNLVAGDTNGKYDIFVKDLTTGAVTRLSTTSSGAQTDYDWDLVDVTADGNGILFYSKANLAIGSYNNHGGAMLYYKDLTTGIIQQVDRPMAGHGSDSYFSYGHLMPDQTKVLFETGDGHMVAGDTNDAPDVFIKNLVTGALTLVSVNAFGVIGNGGSQPKWASADGTHILMMSTATNLGEGDTNNAWDLFMKDLTSGAMERVSLTSNGGQLNGNTEFDFMTDDGHTLVFETYATNLAAGDSNGSTDLYARNMATGAVTSVSSNAAGQLGNAPSNYVYTSADGQTVFFSSASSNLVAGDTNGNEDLFAKNLKTGEITRLLSADTFTDGDLLAYRALYADHGTKLVVQVDHYNAVTDQSVHDHGGVSFTSTSIYVIDLTTFKSTLLTSGSTGLYYNDSQVPLEMFADNPGLSSVTADGEHLVLFMTTDNYIKAGNSYLVDLNATNLQKNVGDNHANALSGSVNRDHMFGLAGNDTLSGLAGDDNIDGGKGADTMIGGLGNDTYYVDNAADAIVELHGGGNDTVYSFITYTLSSDVEKLILTGKANIIATGNAGNNSLIGNAGNNKLLGGDGNDTLGGGDGRDTLDGGKGIDTMKGGADDDKYYLDTASDIVIEYSNGGTDTVQINGTYTLTANVENLIITGTSDRFGTGNALNNTITGNAGNNTLGGADGNDHIDGGKGADLMRGGLGNDIFYVDNPGDVVAEYTNAGQDRVYSSIDFTLGGNVEELFLTGTANLKGTGNSLDNYLSGNSGANILNGGKGNDTLLGGAGADTFVFSAHSGLDTIADFLPAGSDHINLNAYTHGVANTALLSQSANGSDTVIDLGGGNVVTITNTVYNDSALLSHIIW